MSSQPHRSRHQSATKPPATPEDCPLARYGGSYLVNPHGSLQVRVYAHPEPDHSYVVDFIVNGKLVARLADQYTASYALLRAVQCVAWNGLLKLRTPLDTQGMPFRITGGGDARIVSLRRGKRQPYVVVGALLLERLNTDNVWVAFCQGFVHPKHQPNSFEALLRCTEHLIETGIWP